MRPMVRFAIMSIAFAAPASAHAATISDPAGDFVPGFIGSTTLDRDLDVTSFSVNYDSATAVFTVGATLAAAIDPSRPGFYVIGVNTGTGASGPFAPIGAPNVRFNTAFQIQKNGTGTLNGAAINPADILISGNQFSVKLASALFTSTGFTAENYGWNLWPRLAGNLTAIADFAPDNATLSAAGILSVPEPASWAMMITGFGLAGGAMRRWKRLATA